MFLLPVGWSRRLAGPAVEPDAGLNLQVRLIQARLLPERIPSPSRSRRRVAPTWNYTVCRDSVCVTVPVPIKLPSVLRAAKAFLEWNVCGAG